jgi:hypothetical protein
MINRITGKVLDLLIVILIFLIAPLIFIMITSPEPWYSKAIGILLICIITGAVVFCFRQKKQDKEN